MVAPKEASTCRSKGPKGKASTCRSKGPKGEWIETTYDQVIACNSFRGKISQLEVVDGFESRPHKAVSFMAEREKEIKEWSEQKLPKVLPGYSGGRLPGRSEVERCRGEEDEGKDSRERDK